MISDTHEAARYYHRVGLPITLCEGKKPIGAAWQKRRWTLQEIDREYGTRPMLNVGTLLGPFAELVDFDADGPGAGKVLTDLFDGDVPVTPTFESTRGPHRLFQWDPALEKIGKTKLKIGDLELRIGRNGKGCQSLLPPSTTDGFTRKWLVSLDECRPAPLPKHALQRILANSGTKQKMTHRELRAHREHKTCPVSSESSECSVSSVYQAVKAAIEATVPTAAGSRHQALFEFARELKAIASLADADVQSLRQYVQEWHRQALPYICTKPFEETWLDFAEGWEKVKFPAGRGPIEEIFANAMGRPVPTCAEQYEQPALRALVALCRELQCESGNEAFFLAGRTAAGLIGVPHMQAVRWLRLLSVDGVLKRVTVGTRHRASEYLYVGD